MANEEIVKRILDSAKEENGCKAWNGWREEHRGRPDLDDANLSHANLSHANLHIARLSIANLSGADLSSALLYGSDLSGANLTLANLSDADLETARLPRANMSHANLSRALLGGTDLTDTDLSDADLSGANLIWANLSDANLANANLSGVLTTGGYKGKNIANFTNAILNGIRYLDGSGKEAYDGSILDLAAVKGLETVQFDGLQEFIQKAFFHVHRLYIPERLEQPHLVEVALKQITALKQFYREGEHPQLLIEAVNRINEELIQHLKKHPEDVCKINSRVFEELIAEILASYGWQVQISQQTRDGGYDILAIEPSKINIDSRWIIECKRYTKENKVGVDVIRSLYGVKTDMRVPHALLATTSDFTGPARDFKASKYDLHLKGYEGILEWINEYKPNPYGRLYLEDNKLILPDDI